MLPNNSIKDIYQEHIEDIFEEKGKDYFKFDFDKIKKVFKMIFQIFPSITKYSSIWKYSIRKYFRREGNSFF